MSVLDQRSVRSLGLMTTLLLSHKMEIMKGFISQAPWEGGKCLEQCLAYINDQE